MENQTQVVGHDDDGVVEGGSPFSTGAAMAKAETAVSAVAMQARAQVEARFAMALHRPRDNDAVRVRLLGECKRPGFAETARFKKPAGRKQNADGKWVETFIEGPSIRFAEAAIRYMGNIDVQSPVLFDSDSERICRVYVTDLEANTTYSRDVTVEKVVEKKKLREGQKALGVRANSYGDAVYLVPATESEVETKMAAGVSKAIRTLGLRLLPGDILEECMAKCIATVTAKVKEDPDGARKALIDAFAAMGVTPTELKAYTEQELSTLSPAQIVELRELYAAIREGQVTWAEVRKARALDNESDDDGPSAVEDLKERVKRQAKEAAEKKAAEATKAAQATADAKTKPAAGKDGEQQPLGGVK